MATLEDNAIWEAAQVKNQYIIYWTVYVSLITLLQVAIGDDILRMSTQEIESRTRLLDNDIKVGVVFLVECLYTLVDYEK